MPIKLQRPKRKQKRKNVQTETSKVWAYSIFTVQNDLGPLLTQFQTMV
jgi:hypothetical protein